MKKNILKKIAMVCSSFFTLMLVIGANSNSTMRRDGITVRIRKGMHEKVILIDDVVVWQGSLNLLSHKSTTEQMQRIASPKVPNRVSELLDLNVYQKIEIAPDPSMRCELCKGLLVKRTGEKGDFYGCSSFPNCGFTRDL